MLHHRILTEFQIHLRYIVQSLFRPQLNIYDRAQSPPPSPPPQPPPFKLVRVEGTKNFDFDNPRLLEKALPEKKLHQKLILLLKSTKGTKNLEEILFGWIFLGAHTTQTVSKHTWVHW